jgi:hypothetical protein
MPDTSLFEMSVGRKLSLENDPTPGIPAHPKGTINMWGAPFFRGNWSV